MQRSGPRLAPHGSSWANARAPHGLEPVFTRDPHWSGSFTRRVRAYGCRRLLENSREAHLSAAPQEPPQDPWIPCPDEDGEWSQGDQQSPPQGAPTPGRQRLQEVSETALAPRTPSRASQQSLLFASRDRLRKQFEYRRLRKQGRRVHTKSFVLQVAPSDGAHTRLGLTVSRQVGGAVQRNRVKRLVREAFRCHRELFPPASDIVVIAKTGCAPRALADVVDELAHVSAALHAAVRRATRGERGGALS
jgi:ribonuclease P protein component